MVKQWNTASQLCISDKGEQSMPLMNLEQIKEIIPHRDPFLLIDEVEELEPGVRCVAKKY